MNTRPPKQIYLQTHGTESRLLNATQNEVTWCVDRINENDTVYILATPKLASLLERLAQYANLYNAPESAYNARTLAAQIREVLDDSQA